MDFSQLPKMSKTPPTPAEQSTAESEREAIAPVTRQPSYRATSPPVDYGREPYGFSLASAWISLIVGTLCLMMGQNFARWAATKISGKSFATGINWGPQHPTLANQPVAYFDLQGGTAWTETGLFLMGVALLLDAALILFASRGQVPNRGLIGAAVGITGVALVINILLAGYLLSLGITPIVSMVIILVGGFVLFDHVPLLRRSPVR